MVVVRDDRRPFHRRIVSSGARFLAKLLFAKLRRYRDPTTEMILIRRELCPLYNNENIYIKPFVPLFLIVEKPAEIEIQLALRSSGKSSFKIKWIFMYFYELLDLIIRR